MLLLLGGAFLALCGFLTALLTIVRAQKLIPFVYLLAAVISAAAMPRAVGETGLHGASYGYLLIMVLTAALLVLLFAGALAKRYKAHNL